MLIDHEHELKLQARNALKKSRFSFLARKEFLIGSSCVLGALFLALAAFIIFSPLSLPSRSQRAREIIRPVIRPVETGATTDRPIYVAFVGNSFTLWNRLPALVGELGSGNTRAYACARGDGTLASNVRAKTKEVRRDRRTEPPEFLDSVEQLLLEGSSGWDAVVLQDHSRGPIKSWEEGAAALRDLYAPLLKRLTCGSANVSQTHCLRTVVLFTTWAYDDWTSRKLRLTRGTGPYANADAEGLADFTRKLHKGYARYASALRAELPGVKIVLAPVGLAFEVVRTVDGDLWHNLFSRRDHMHPSPAGSFLIASVIYGTLQRALAGPGTAWSGALHGQGELMASWTEQNIRAGWAPEAGGDTAGFGAKLGEVPSVESKLLGAALAAVAA